MKYASLLFLSFLLYLSGCSGNDEPSLSSENKITSFNLTYNDQTFSGSINHNTRTVKIKTLGLEQNTSLVPEISISEGAGIFPSPNTSQNFNEVIEYIVTAENGEKAIYTVIAENQLYSPEKDILSFNLVIDGETFSGDIDQETGTIEVTTGKDVSAIAPEITLSDQASVSPAASEIQDFNQPVEYTVTAQDGTTKVYTVIINKIAIKATYKMFYTRATSFAQVNYLDISSDSYELFLENNNNSYKLDHFDVEVWESNGKPISNFNYTLNENIVTADDYVLRFKVNGKIMAESDFTLDVLAENVPKIFSASKSSYYYTDTLILYGENLVQGLAIPANGNIYLYDSRYVSINADRTEIQLDLSVNRTMFPGYVGGESPRPTRISIFINGRYGDSIVVDFE